MTRKEAEHDAQKLNKTEPKWFCPLIKDDCNKRCVNFENAYVINKDEKANQMISDVNADTFEVRGYMCSNASFVGDFICGMD